MEEELERIEEEAQTDETPAEAAETPEKEVQAPSEAEEEALAQQVEALRAFDPQAPTVDEILEGEHAEAFLENAEKTGSLLDAYKLTFFDELQARQASRIRQEKALRSAEKAHLRRTQAHGADAVLVTREMLDAYRVFDPEITAAEIRRYEARDIARKNKR